MSEFPDDMRDLPAKKHGDKAERLTTAADAAAAKADTEDDAHDDEPGG